jgi:hypothetical protein
MQTDAAREPRAVLDQFVRSRFAVLTTYRVDGRPVATPMWIVVDESKAYVISRGPGKVRRIRNDARVSLARSTSRGFRTGPEVQGRAQLLGSNVPRRLRMRLLRKYGPFALLAWALARILRLKLTLIEIEVTP